MIERVIVVHSDRGRHVDGIRDYSRRLVEELPQHSVRAELRTPPAGSFASELPELLRSWWELGRATSSTAIVVQYSPFCFARWGFAPWVPVCLLAIRARSGGPRVAIMVHEPYVPMDSWRSTAIGLWQRLQLTSVRLAAEVVFTSIDTWAERFRRRPPVRETRHLPVGSNLPDRRSERDDQRRRMGVEEDTLVLGAMGRDHPSWMAGYVVDAANAVAATGRPVILLCLGAEAPALSGLDRRVEVDVPGYLEADALAARLAASDLFLAPLVDGVSTRRGTLRAALHHGLPVVGTVGSLTDRVLHESGAAMRATPVGRPDLFAAEAVRLADDPAARAAAAAAARGLYERSFDWPVIARDLLDALPTR